MRVSEQEWDYHERELGTENAGWRIFQDTGLIGVWVMILVVVVSLVILVVASPFVLFGVAEIITKGPTQWRVRWRRPS